MTIQNMILTLVCAIVSGILATSITLYVNHKSEIRRAKLQIVSDIFGYRFLINKNTNNEKFYAAMNKVPIIFSKDKKVMEIYEILHSASLIKDANERKVKMNDCLVSFLKEICNASGIDCKSWNDSKIFNVFG